MDHVPPPVPRRHPVLPEKPGADFYYVVKTDHIRRLVSQGRCYFLFRLRRFCKTLLVDTLREQFKDSEALFQTAHLTTMKQAQDGIQAFYTLDYPNLEARQRINRNLSGPVRQMVSEREKNLAYYYQSTTSEGTQTYLKSSFLIFPIQ